MDSMNSLFKAKKNKQYANYNKTVKSMETKYANLQFMQPSGQNNVPKPQKSGSLLGFTSNLPANPESCGFSVRSGVFKSTGCVPKSAYKPFINEACNNIPKQYYSK